MIQTLKLISDSFDQQRTNGELPPSGLLPYLADVLYPSSEGWLVLSTVLPALSPQKMTHIMVFTVTTYHELPLSKENIRIFLIQLENSHIQFSALFLLPTKCYHGNLIIFKKTDALHTVITEDYIQLKKNKNPM